jgi:hypothetical protein
MYKEKKTSSLGENDVRFSTYQTNRGSVGPCGYSTHHFHVVVGRILDNDDDCDSHNVFFINLFFIYKLIYFIENHFTTMSTYNERLKEAIRERAEGHTLTPYKERILDKYDKRNAKRNKKRRDVRKAGREGLDMTEDDQRTFESMERDKERKNKRMKYIRKAGREGLDMTEDEKRTFESLERRDERKNKKIKYIRKAGKEGLDMTEDEQRTFESLERRDERLNKKRRDIRKAGREGLDMTEAEKRTFESMRKSEAKFRQKRKEAIRAQKRGQTLTYKQKIIVDSINRSRDHQKERYRAKRFLEHEALRIDGICKFRASHSRIRIWMKHLLKTVPIDGKPLERLSIDKIPHYYGVTSRPKDSVYVEGLRWTRKGGDKRPTFLWENGKAIGIPYLRAIGFKVVVLVKSATNLNIRKLEGSFHEEFEDLDFGIRGWRENDKGSRQDHPHPSSYKLFVCYSREVPALLDKGVIKVNYPETLC